MTFDAHYNNIYLDTQKQNRFEQRDTKEIISLWVTHNALVHAYRRHLEHFYLTNAIFKETTGPSKIIPPEAWDSFGWDETARKQMSAYFAMLRCIPQGESLIQEVLGDQLGPLRPSPRYRRTNKQFYRRKEQQGNDEKKEEENLTRTDTRQWEHSHKKECMNEDDVVLYQMPRDKVMKLIQTKLNDLASGASMTSDSIDKSSSSGGVASTASKSSGSSDSIDDISIVRNNSSGGAASTASMSSGSSDSTDDNSIVRNNSSGGALDDDSYILHKDSNSSSSSSSVTSHIRPWIKKIVVPIETSSLLPSHKYPELFQVVPEVLSIQHVFQLPGIIAPLPPPSATATTASTSRPVGVVIAPPPLTAPYMSVDGAVYNEHQLISLIQIRPPSMNQQQQQQQQCVPVKRRNRFLHFLHSSCLQKICIYPVSSITDISQVVTDIYKKYKEML